MADNHVQVAPDSTGKKLQTFNNTIGTDDVHAEAVVLVDSAGTAITIDNPLSATIAINAPVDVAQVGGTNVGANNALYVSAGSGATFPISGTVTVNDGVKVSAATGATFPVSGTVTPSNTATTGLFVSSATGAVFPISAATGATFPISGTLSQSTKHDAKAYLTAVINSAMIGPNGPITVVAAVANKVCKVHSYTLQVSAATGETFYFTDGSAGTTISQHWTLQGREGLISSFVSAPAHHFKTTANTLLALSGGTGVHIDGAVVYSVDDAT